MQNAEDFPGSAPNIQKHISEQNTQILSLEQFVADKDARIKKRDEEIEDHKKKNTALNSELNKTKEKAEKFEN